MCSGQGMASFQEVKFYLMFNPLFSFQDVGIERFHCTQRCPHFRAGLEQRSSIVRNREVSLYTKVSSFRGLDNSRGVLISGGWIKGVPL